MQEDCGGYNAFVAAYDVAFGNLLGKTYPVPGNHEYKDEISEPNGTDCPAQLPSGQPPTAEGYFRYLQEARTAGSLPLDLPADAPAAMGGTGALVIADAEVPVAWFAGPAPAGGGIAIAIYALAGCDLGTLDGCNWT